MTDEEPATFEKDEVYTYVKKYFCYVLHISLIFPFKNYLDSILNSIHFNSLTLL